MPTQTKASSRISKKQQSQAVRLTLIFGALAVGLSVFFLFVVLPNFGRMSLLFGGDGQQPKIEDTVPPQRPALFALPVATNSASIKITGYTEPNSTSFLIWDSTQAKQVGVSDEGDFSFSVLLKEGNNSFSVYAQDEAGNDSPPSETFSVVYDATPPKLEIIGPLPDQKFQGTKNQRLTITGETEPGVKVYVNERLVSSTSEGVFSNTTIMSEGENLYKIVAKDPAGNETQTELKVSFSL